MRSLRHLVLAAALFGVVNGLAAGAHGASPPRRGAFPWITLNTFAMPESLLPAVPNVAPAPASHPRRPDLSATTPTSAPVPPRGGDRVVSSRAQATDSAATRVTEAAAPRAQPAALTVIDRPGVVPGGVATVLVTADAPAGAHSARYAVRTVDGIRLFGATSGTAVVHDGRISVPVTFGVPGDAGAGWLDAGALELDWEGVASDTIPFGIEVATRRALSFELASEELTVSPGRSVGLPYTLTNRGNAPDSVGIEVLVPGGWTVAVDRHTARVQAGDSLTGEIRFLAPSRAPLGDGAVVALTARGSDAHQARSVRLVVVAEKGPVGSLAHVPGSVFVGSSTGGGTPSVAVTASGEALPGVQVDLAVRAMDALAPPPSFREPMAGPRLRLGIGTALWMLAIGDVYSASSAFTGPVLGGRGVDLSWRDDAGRSVEVFAARPLSYGYDTEDGRILRAAGGIETGIGRFGIQLSDVSRGSDLWQPYGTRSVTGGYRLRSRTHRVDVQAGVMTVSADTIGSKTGLTVDGRYEFTGRRSRISARLRQVPGTAQRTASFGDEAFLSGSYEVRPDLTLTGWGFTQDSERLDAMDSRTWGGAGGVGIRLPADARLQLLGTYRETDHESAAITGSVTRTVRAGLDVPLRGRSVGLELDADIGTVHDADDRPFRMARAGVRWTDVGRWAWVGASYSDFGYGAPSTTLDASTSLQLGGASLFGGLTARVQGPNVGSPFTFWSGSTIPVADRTRLSLGLDYRPFGASSRLQLSLGVTRDFRLPLPMSRRTTVDGVVFEDLNGNRRRDEDEPARAGLPLRLGPVRAVTDDHGRFRFYDRIDGELRIEPGALPLGMVVPSDVYLPTSGHVEIPLIRTATAEITVFVDRDGDGERDSAETVAENALVSLEAGTGLIRESVTGVDGRVRFGGLEPAVYDVLIYPIDAGERSTTPIRAQIEVGPGQVVGVELPIPLHRRQIRIRGGGEMSGFRGTG